MSSSTSSDDFDGRLDWWKEQLKMAAERGNENIEEEVVNAMPKLPKDAKKAPSNEKQMWGYRDDTRRNMREAARRRQRARAREEKTIEEQLEALQKKADEMLGEAESVAGQIHPTTVVYPVTIKSKKKGWWRKMWDNPPNAEPRQKHDLDKAENYIQLVLWWLDNLDERETMLILRKGFVGLLFLIMLTFMVGLFIAMF